MKGEREAPFPTPDHLERYWRNNPSGVVRACQVEMYAYPSFLQEVILRRAGTGVRIEIDFFSYRMMDHDLAKHVSVHYEVASLSIALAWIHRRFLHTITDFRTTSFPPPPDEYFEDSRPQSRRYEAAWRRLREDFRKGRLIDKKLKVVFRRDGD